MEYLLVPVIGGNPQRFRFVAVIDDGGDDLSGRVALGAYRAVFTSPERATINEARADANAFISRCAEVGIRCEYATAIRLQPSASDRAR